MIIQKIAAGLVIISRLVGPLEPSAAMVTAGKSEDNSMVKNEWNNYQKSNVGNSAKWRIENLDLRQFAGKDKTLLDLGANHGEFAVELADDFKHITALEPFVQAPELSENVTWVAKGFKDYIAETKDQFDVVFSFAMTIQVRDNDGLSEHDIARGHHDLVKQNGIMIYETQKIQNRPLNQAHVDKMLTAFRMKFGKEIKSALKPFWILPLLICNARAPPSRQSSNNFLPVDFF